MQTIEKPHSWGYAGLSPAPPYNTFKVYWGECQERMTWEMAGRQHSYEVLMLTTEHQNQSCAGDDTPLWLKNWPRRTTGWLWCAAEKLWACVLKVLRCLLMWMGFWASPENLPGDCFQSLFLGLSSSTVAHSWSCAFFSHWLPTLCVQRFIFF